MKKVYDVVLFDADGTLYDFDTSEANAVSEVLTSVGLPTDKDTVSLYHDINDAEWRALERGETTREKLKVDRFRKLIEALSRRGVRAADTADANVMCMRYVEALSRQCILFPDAEDVCRELSSRASLYIITNGITRVQRGRFARSPITKYFDDVFISEAMGAVKPERRYFELVFEAIGMPKDEARTRALVVGDSPTSDIAGASAFGLDSCFIDRAGKGPGASCPTYTIRSLYELLDICPPRRGGTEENV